MSNPTRDQPAGRDRGPSRPLVCRTCHTDNARPTKTECWACYHYRRANGQTRSENIILKNNLRRHEQETLRRRPLP